MVALHNFYLRVRSLFTGELLDEYDGRLYPFDESPIYDCCARPGCGHYRCEHDDGFPKEIVYSKNPEEVGQHIQFDPGCMNAGCHCEGFWEKQDLYDFVQELNVARIHALYELEQVPGVRHVDTRVKIVVPALTYMEREHFDSNHDALFAAEEKLYAKFPKVLFDFSTSWRVQDLDGPSSDEHGTTENHGCDDQR
jgi:hypothetical protein